jgi:hypothetical protein
VAEKIVKTPMDKNISVKINPAIAQELFESHDVSAMREMRYGIPEYFPRRRDPLKLEHGFGKFPPGTGGFMLAVEIYLSGANSLHCAAQAGVMNQAPGFALRVIRHAEAIVENFGNHVFEIPNPTA